MDRPSLVALLTAMGLVGNDQPFDLLAMLEGRTTPFGTPSDHSLTNVAGGIVAAWYSIHTMSVDICVVDPVSGNCQTRFTHPALGPKPTSGELWDYLHICLSGIAAQMALGRKVRGGECVEILTTARTIAERIATLSPFPHQPWTDALNGGSFTVTRMFARKPPTLVSHVLDVSYRRARTLSGERLPRINALMEVITEKGLLLQDDFKAILGERKFTMYRTR